MGFRIAERCRHDEEVRLVSPPTRRFPDSSRMNRLGTGIVAKVRGSQMGRYVGDRRGSFQPGRALVALSDWGTHGAGRWNRGGHGPIEDPRGLAASPSPGAPGSDRAPRVTPE